MSVYAELQVTSHFSFLRGASSCDELFKEAAALGLTTLAIVDRNSLAGIVRAHVAAKEHGVRLIVGCRLDLTDGTSLLVYPKDRPAYSRLCRLLSLGKSRGGKANCLLDWSDVETFSEGLIAILLADQADDMCALNLRRLKSTFWGDGYLALTIHRRPRDAQRLHGLAQLAAEYGVLTVVTNDVLFHAKARHLLQDVMTCIRHNCTIDTAGFRLEARADRYLKPAMEMARLFRHYPDAVARSAEIADQCRFSLDELAYQYPEERTMPGLTAQEALTKLTWEGADRRYPTGVPEKVKATVEHELALIASLGYAPYFLTVNSIVQFARSKGILCQGRGSAANSVVCFVLGVTSIDPIHHDLLFERFISMERAEPPDIDVDFEHDRREDVIQWVYETYGRNHAALTAVVTRYRTKGALRDVGKVMGLPEDLIKSISSEQSSYSREGANIERIRELNINIDDRRIRLTLELAEQLRGMPRHLSQHPGGFVLTHDRLDELVPIEPAAMVNRQVIEWDKEDIDVLKFMKVDVLALGMLSCIRRSFELLSDHKDLDFELATIPQEDPATYAMIQKADTLGTFQIESRAQMSMLPRIKPATFYDLVIEVAIVRPGPIQGDMVHPFLRRREGLEPVSFPTPELRQVLGKTLGVPLFQEQAMRVAITCAGFSPGEADQLRRAMATFKFTGGVSKFQDKMIEGMVSRGYPREFAERTFTQIQGFGSYGFPESHAASFALIAYASCWIKCHHPDVFCAALLNSQPMGFYAPAQIVRDAREHGVEVRPICINASRWDCTLERKANGQFAVRLGFRMVKSMANTVAAHLVAARAEEPFTSIDDIWRRAEASVATLTKLAEADAFAVLGLRRDVLWTIKGLRDPSMPLFAATIDRPAVPEVDELAADLPRMTPGAEVVEDYNHVGLTLRQHPLSFLRNDMRRRRIKTCGEAMSSRDGQYVHVAGLVLVRQMPGSAKGVVFITLEDETGIANVIVWPKTYEAQRRAVVGSKMVLISGHLQREGEVVHLIARSVADISHELNEISGHGAIELKPGRGDEFAHGGPGQDSRVRAADAAAAKALDIKSRNFH